MIFRRISYILAAQFTAFVFGLLLITGILFLSVDVVQGRRETVGRLERQLVEIVNRSDGALLPSLPPFQRERIRVTDVLGSTLFAGTLYEDIPFSAQPRVQMVERGGERYDILTQPVFENGRIVGYLQVADRSQPDFLGMRMLLFLMVSAGISALTFGVGLFFARRNLKPAEQMMERLEQFTQDASHELRTPLTAIGTSLDLALASPDNANELRSAKQGVKDVAMLVERLLELARLDAYTLKREPVDLSDLVARTIEMHTAEADVRNIRIKHDITPGITVQGDPSLVRQVVSNLLANAVKFNVDGGTVTVRLSKNRLSVKDTGNGIAPDALRKIFDRFYREDAARTSAKDGLGLGLALVKRIVDLHGWAIDVESEMGNGSAFTVKF